MKVEPVATVRMLYTTRNRPMSSAPWEPAKRMRSVAGGLVGGEGQKVGEGKGFDRHRTGGARPHSPSITIDTQKT